MPKFKRTKNNRTEDSIQTSVDAYFLLPTHWKDTLRKWKEIPIECQRCYAVYYESENIGQWQCKQHAREWNGRYDGKFYPIGTWDCCGETTKDYQEYLKKGCVRADHSPLSASFQLSQDDLYMPIAILQYIRVKREAVLFKNQSGELEPWDPAIGDGECVIRRFDWKEDLCRKINGKSLKDDFFTRDIASGHTKYRTSIYT